MQESKKVVGDDAIIVNPTILRGVLNHPLKKCPRRGRRIISTAPSEDNSVYLSEKELAIGAWLSETSLG